MLNLEALSTFWRGRSGERAIPPLDGPLRQNDELEAAWPALEKLDDPQDLVFDQSGRGYLSLNKSIARYDPVRGGNLETAFTFDSATRGLAVSGKSEIAVCLDGEGVVVLSADGRKIAGLTEVDGRKLAAPTSVIFLDDGSLVITDASQSPGAEWKRDYLLSGKTGRIIHWDMAGNARSLADDLAFPYGICEGADKTLLFTQAWDHSVWELGTGPASGKPRVRLSNLPGIPARIRRAEDGGYWLSFLTLRSRMVEFLKKQKKFCAEMMSATETGAWIAPELYSSAYDPHPWKLPPHTPESRLFAPGQIGALRRNGAINPWAPTRSYGLIAKLNRDVEPEASFHARANSVYHGLTSVCESQGALWIVCNGYGALLKYSTLPGVERASEAVVKRKTPRERIATFLSRRSSTQTMAKSAALQVIDGTKFYGDAAAIKDMNITLNAGEIHALLGENGAGKSTISKAMAGAIALSSGSILIAGEPVRFQSSADALKAGVAMVFQETSLVPYMTVAQNIVLGNERIAFSQRQMEIEAQEFLASLNFAGIDVTVFASALGRGHKQIVEIARALYNNAKVIIFDEPTASLSPGETARFFELLEMLKQRGVAIVFISHNLEEALDLADRVSIMRDGKLVATGPANQFSRSLIVSHMVGREDAGKHYTMIGRQAERWTRKRKILGVENLRYSPLVKNMSFSVYEGEITCIAGLVGAGRSEMAKVVAGVYRRDISLGGKVYLNGSAVSYRQPINGIRDGIVYLTEDRKIDGIFETMGIEDNIYMGHLAINSWPFSLVSRKVSGAIAKRLIGQLKIKSIDMRHPVNRLSGGNQQKVVLGKALVQKPKLLIVDEPTRGVDVGAIDEIHSALRELAREGVAVVVISSYLPEVLKLADRVLVARRGQIVAEFASAEATEARIMAAALY